MEATSRADFKISSFKLQRLEGERPASRFSTFNVG